MRRRITLVPEDKLFDKLTKRLLRAWIYLDYNDYQYLLNNSCDSHDISSLGNIQLTWQAPQGNFSKTTIVCETPLEKRGWVKISSMHFCDVLSIFGPVDPKCIYFLKLIRNSTTEKMLSQNFLDSFCRYFEYFRPHGF